MPWSGFVRPQPWRQIGYRASDLAEAFGISRDAVYQLAKAGKLPFVRLSPRRMIFPYKALRAMLNRGYALQLETKETTDGPGKK